MRHNRFNTTAGTSSTQMFNGSQSNSQSQIDLTLVDQENIHFDWIKEERIIERTEKFSSKVLAVDDKVRAMKIVAEIVKFRHKFFLQKKNKATSITLNIAITAAVSACTPSTMAAMMGPLKFGIYCIDPRLMKKGRFIGVHKDEIRDMKFGSGFLLTGSK